MASRGASPRGSNPGSDTEQEIEATQPGGKSYQQLEDNVELLSEKRSSTREEALAVINKQLKLNYNYEFVEQKKLTILESLKKGLKKGGSKEQRLSAEALALMMLTLGAGTEDIYNEVAPTFQELAVDSTNEAVRIAVLDALAVCTFVANLEEPATIAVLNLFWSLLTNGKKTVAERTSALRGWSLLITTLTSQYVFSQLVPTHLTIVVQFLKSEDVDIRVAAGECIALLIEMSKDEEGEQFENNSFGEYAGVDLDEILDQLYTLTSTTGKVKAKKDKVKQKAPFKAIIKFIETGDVLGESLSFKHQKFEFNTWAEMIQLNALRFHLDEGLAVHFEKNDLLGEIFDIFIDRELKRVTLTHVEKRYYLSPNSAVAKAKTREMNKQRKQRRQFEDSYQMDES